jgi:hypothetical protein
MLWTEIEFGERPPAGLWVVTWSWNGSAENRERTGASRNDQAVVYVDLMSEASFTQSLSKVGSR